MTAADGGTGPAGPERGPVAPGSGWPDDPATPATPVAHDAAGVRALAAGAGGMTELAARYDRVMRAWFMYATDPVTRVRIDADRRQIGRAHV